MNDIEIIICLLLLFMVVPDWCRRVGRPSLIYSVFVLFGIGLAPVAEGPVREMLMQAGKVGFLLLLFEVGLEIDLPRFREFAKPLRHALLWGLIQYPLILALASMAGLNLGESLVTAAAITGCSVGMAYPAWKNYPALGEEARVFTLRMMVALEMICIVVLAVNTAALEEGFGWVIGLKLVGIMVAILMISRFSAHLVSLFQTVIEKTTHWRVHLIVLLVLMVCAIGERLGLSAAKTAFFLGLFMARARHHGMNLEQYISPISQRLLIPIFFVTLGLQVDWKLLFSLTGLMAVGTAFFILGCREVLHRRFFPTGGDAHSFLLFCPNLTMIALGASALLVSSPDPRIGGWLVLTGLFMTVPTLLMLPQSKPEPATPVITTPAGKAAMAE